MLKIACITVTWRCVMIGLWFPWWEPSRVSVRTTFFSKPAHTGWNSSQGLGSSSLVHVWLHIANAGVLHQPRPHLNSSDQSLAVKSSFSNTGSVEVCGPDFYPGKLLFFTSILCFLYSGHRSLALCLQLLFGSKTSCWFSFCSLEDRKDNFQALCMLVLKAPFQMLLFWKASI